MLYAVLCYDAESEVNAWSKELDAKVMADLGAVNQRYAEAGKLGPVARLMPTTAAVTVRKGATDDIVMDGPFAETKEQFLGFFVLDVETLELLEELLAGYAGTLLLVSHDRDFLDNVVTGTLALEGDGRVGEYVGGYSDWQRQYRPPAARKPATKPPADEERRPAQPVPPARRKLGYKEARELEALPARIEALEGLIARLGLDMQDPAFYQQDAAAIVAANAELASKQQELDAAYQRWAELDAG